MHKKQENYGSLYGSVRLVEKDHSDLDRFFWIIQCVVRGPCKSEFICGSLFPGSAISTLLPNPVLSGDFFIFEKVEFRAWVSFFSA